MKPDRFVGLRINDIGVDEQGRHILVINCQCTLPHATCAVYEASHLNGCLMRPSEGVVYEMDGDKVTGWGCENIFGRTLSVIPAEKQEDIQRQMNERMEQMNHGYRRARKSGDLGG